MPNQNDELVRYVLEVEDMDAVEVTQRILAELMKDGYERGCTISMTVRYSTPMNSALTSKYDISYGGTPHNEAIPNAMVAS